MGPCLKVAAIVVACLTLLGCADTTAPKAPTEKGREKGPGERAGAGDRILSHLRQPVGEHVTLEVVGGMKGGCGAAKLEFVRVLPDGSADSGPGGTGYRVP